jgi:hypothetical protein
MPPTGRTPELGAGATAVTAARVAGRHRRRTRPRSRSREPRGSSTPDDQRNTAEAAAGCTRPLRSRVPRGARLAFRLQPDCRRRRPGFKVARSLPLTVARFRRPDGGVPGSRRKSKPHPTGGIR